MEWFVSPCQLFLHQLYCYIKSDWNKLKISFGLCQLVPSGCHLETAGWTEYSSLPLASGKHQCARRLKIKGSCFSTSRWAEGAINRLNPAVCVNVHSCHKWQFRLSGCSQDNFLSKVDLIIVIIVFFFLLLVYSRAQQKPKINILQKTCCSREVMCYALRVLVLGIWNKQTNCQETELFYNCRLKSGQLGCSVTGRRLKSASQSNSLAASVFPPFLNKVLPTAGGTKQRMWSSAAAPSTANE